MKMNQEWLKQYRKYIEQFVKVTDEEWIEFTNQIYIIRLKKKEYFIKPHDKKIKIGFIINGILRTFFIAENGNEYTTDFCTENEISVNYKISGGNQEEEYYSQSLDDSIILTINYNDPNNKLKNNSKFELLKSRLIEYYYPDKVEREKNLLSLNAEERYLHFLKKYNKIIDKIPQYHIASYLGITPIALSRLRKKLKKS